MHKRNELVKASLSGEQAWINKQGILSPDASGSTMDIPVDIKSNGTQLIITIQLEPSDEAVVDYNAENLESADLEMEMALPVLKLVFDTNASENTALLYHQLRDIKNFEYYN